MDPDTKVIDALVKKDFEERFAKRMEDARKHRNTRLASVLCELHIVEWLARQRLDAWPTLYPSGAHRNAWQKAVSDWCARNAKHWNMQGQRGTFERIVIRGFAPSAEPETRYDPVHTVLNDVPHGLTHEEAVVAIWRLFEGDEVEPSETVFAKASEVPEAVVSVETLYPKSLEQQIAAAKTLV